MRVLFLTKQQYMGKDLLRDRFGRFYELPRILALGGHHVRGVCLKYRSTGDDAPVARQCLEDVEWDSFQLGWNWPAAFFKHYRRLIKIAADFATDIVVGASDAMHVIMAASLAAKFRVPLAVDLYDNFESYGVTRLPGIKKGLERGIVRADAISTVSDELAAKVRREYRPTGIVRTISNGVCPEIFCPVDKKLARRRLGLPESGSLVGTAGSLSRNRGMEVLFQAFEKLSSKRSNLFLVVAGREDRGLRIPTNDKIRYLGDLRHSEIGYLFNALDVGIICNERNQFGKYCFPQKFYEMIACRLPIAAADVGVLRQMLIGNKHCLFEAGHLESLVNVIERQLDTPHVLNFSVPAWNDRGIEFQQLLEQAISSSLMTRMQSRLDQHRRI
jgi:teichuronic acid biosynthesis glycosyltransferase TuaC